MTRSMEIERRRLWLASFRTTARLLGECVILAALAVSLIFLGAALDAL